MGISSDLLNRGTRDERLIDKFTKSAFDKIYGEEVNVYIEQDLGSLGLFRNKEVTRSKVNEISYDKGYFINWKLIIHEITHFEVHISYNPKTKRFRHSQKFINAFNRNLRKVRPLEQEFLKMIIEEIKDGN